jgi:hypothetical protein
MNTRLVKAAVTIGGAIALGTISGPLITISSPLWGLFGTKVSVDLLALAGLSAIAGAGMSLGGKSGESLDAGLEKMILEAEIMAQQKKLMGLQDKLSQIHQPTPTTP